jgi:hypothetical protein
MADGFIIKPFRVSFDGESYVYFTRSRGKALSESWQAYTSIRENISFKDFLRRARAWKEAEPGLMFGMPITVSGRPAFMVSSDRHYIQFVYPGSDVILSSHPLDVEPNEARRFTSYFQEEPEHEG